MRAWIVLAAAVAFVGLAGLVQAEEPCCPAGAWKWSVTMGDQTREVTLKLQRDGEKLTGTITGRGGRAIEIGDGKFADGNVSFTVTMEREGRKFVRSYCGKLEGDTIKGTMSFEREGQKQSREWVAKRVKE